MVTASLDDVMHALRVVADAIADKLIEMYERLANIEMDVSDIADHILSKHERSDHGEDAEDD